MGFITYVKVKCININKSNIKAGRGHTEVYYYKVLILYAKYTIISFLYYMPRGIISLEGRLDKLKIYTTGDLPGAPVVKTPWFHCRGHQFHPW